MKNEFEKYAKKHLGVSGTLLNDYEKFQNSLKGPGDSDPYNTEASLTPYIIEERPMRMTQMDIFSRLMMDRIIWIAGGIDDSVSTVVQAQLLFMNSLNDSLDVTLHLDTPGGSIKSGLSIIDVMEMVDYDIATINTGMCASMGSVLLGAGTPGKRSSLRFSKVMTHQVSGGTQGNIQDMRINHEEAEKYNFILFKLLGKYSGKTWKEVMEHSQRDRWYSADEAKEFGFIDEIIKTNELTYSDLIDGFDEYETYIKER